jgi:hypothetical protein
MKEILKFNDERNHLLIWKHQNLSYPKVFLINIGKDFNLWNKQFEKMQLKIQNDNGHIVKVLSKKLLIGLDRKYIDDDHERHQHSRFATLETSNSWGDSGSLPINPSFHYEFLFE